MLNWNRYSLRKQLLLLFIFVQFVLLVGLMFFFYNNYHQSYLDQLESSLRHQAILISDHSISEINDKSAKEVDNWSKEMSIEIKKRITIIDREGIVIADSDYKPEEMDNHLGRPEIQELLSGAGVGSSIRQSDTLKRNMFYLAIPIQEDNRIVGFIRLSKSLEEINRTVTDNIKNNLVFFLFMILLTLFFVWKITKNIINPLSEVTHIAGNLAKGNFQERITIKGYENEIGSLVKVFNFMASQLESKIKLISEEKNRAEAILISMVDGLVATDRKLNIKLVNPSAKKIFLLEHDSVKGNKVIEIFRHYEIEQALEQAMERNKTITKEIVIQKEEKRTLRCNFAPINNDAGIVIGGIVVFSDITELRRLEQLRKDFVANVSHELRTPLTSIIGYVDTLLENEIEDKSIFDSFLGIVKKEADRLSLLIKDLLDLSKLESKSKYILRPGLLNNVINKTTVILKDKARKKDIDLKIKINKEFMVYMIPEQIEQVLINLIDNAIKYTPDGGRVKVKAVSKDEKVLVEVIDSGIGIPSQELDRIFERFYRIDKARSRSQGGTGIGLSIVKHVMNNHNNKIEVESQPGQGSIFRFYLDIVKD